MTTTGTNELQVLGWYQAAYDFEAANEAELSLTVGDVIKVYFKEGEWWEGELSDGRCGLFPGNHVAEYDGNCFPNGNQNARPSISPGEVEIQQPIANQAQWSPKPAQPVYESKQAAPKTTAPVVFTPKPKPEKPKGKTFFGLWSSYMAILAGSTVILLGIGNLIWYGVYKEKYGTMYLVAGLYALFLGAGTIVFEYTRGMSRRGDKMPIRGIVYLILTVLLFTAIPTIFGAAMYLMVAGVNFIAAYNGEEYQAPKKRTDLKPEEEKHGGPQSLQDKFIRWILVKRQQNQIGVVVFLSLYVATNLIIFFNALAVWVEKNDNFPPGERLSGWAPFAKAFGNLLDWNCSIIVLPVLRSIIRWLYNTSTGSQSLFAKCLRGVLAFVPLDQAIEFHKLVAKVSLFGAVGHTVMHLINYINSPQPTLDKFGTVPWWTGGIILLSMLFIYSAAAPVVKNGQFEIFWYSHHCFVIYFFFLIIHGAGGFNPNFWKWFLLPGTLYIAERILRIQRANKKVVLLSVTNMKPNVIALEFAKDQGGIWAEPYNDGQYVFIKCPTLSRIQWHPFTISSAPEQETVTIHIRKCGKGSWTQDLADLLCAFGNRNASRFELSRMGPSGQPLKGKITGPDGLPLIQIDGPHSAPTQHVTEYHTVMVIGGGIGVTPVAATLKSVLLHRWKYGMGQCFPDNAYFYWACSYRDIESFRWFIRAVKECEDEMYDRRAKNAKDMYLKKFEFHMFISSVPKDVRPAILSIPEEDDEYSFWGKASREDDRKRGELNKIPAPFTDLELYSFCKCPNADMWTSPQYQQLIPSQGVYIPSDNSYIQLGDDIFIWSGRPKWGERFQAIVDTHPTGDIGVAFCGNPHIANDLKKMCYNYSSLEDGRIFRLHKENF